MKKIIGFGIFAFIFAFNFLAPAFADSIEWLHSYDEALKAASANNKPIMAFFYTSWCGWCRKLDAVTFKDGGVVEASKEFVPVRIDGEKDRKISYGYGVGAYPAILFLDPSGRTIWREYGFREAPKLAGSMQGVLSAFKRNTRVQPYLEDAFAKVARGEMDKAVAVISDAIMKYPDDSRLYSARGAIYLNKGDTDTALQDFDRAISINPNDDNAYVMRGVIYYKKRDLDKALEDCSKAISINRWAYEAYNGRGMIYLERGEADLAIKNFNTVVLINPNYASAYLSRGIAYISKGVLDKAASDFSMAIIIDPGLLNAYSNRAYVYFMMKDYDKSWDDVFELERRGRKVSGEFMEELIKAPGGDRRDEGYGKYSKLLSAQPNME